MKPASSLPQQLNDTSSGAEPAGWVPLNANRRSGASSTAANLNTRLAMDDDLRTWWQPDAAGKAPMLTSTLVGNATVNAIRIVWHDIGINTRKGITPGAFRYKVELQTTANTWTTVIDRSDSKDDLFIDYRECPQPKQPAPDSSSWARHRG